MALFASLIAEHSVRTKYRRDGPLDDRDEFVERWIVAAILDHVAGMANCRTVTAEGCGDLIKRDLKGDMANIHGDLPDMAERAAPVTTHLDPMAGKHDHLGGDLCANAAHDTDTVAGAAA
jgi:hypothetical protein